MSVSQWNSSFLVLQIRDILTNLLTFSISKTSFSSSPLFLRLSKVNHLIIQTSKEWIFSWPYGTSYSHPVQRGVTFVNKLVCYLVQISSSCVYQLVTILMNAFIINFYLLICLSYSHVFLSFSLIWWLVRLQFLSSKNNLYTSSTFFLPWCHPYALPLLSPSSCVLPSIRQAG